MSILVFIYGTLKKGMCRSDILKKSKYIGTATTDNCYRLCHLGQYPGLISCEKGAGDHVYGELYSISESVIPILDSIEGEGFLFKRERINLHETCIALLPREETVFQHVIAKQAYTYLYINALPLDVRYLQFWVDSMRN